MGVNQSWFTFWVKIFGWIRTDSLWSIYEFVCVSDLIAMLWAGTCFASIACGHPHAHFWGVPQTLALFLRDDSDADDACDAVLRISLYHISDSASSASFWFCAFRSIIVFAFFNSKPQASFRISVTVVTVFLAYPYPYPINIVTTVTIVT